MKANELLPANVPILISGRNVYIRPLTINEINEKYLSWINDPEINKYLEVRNKEQKLEDLISYVNGIRSKKGCEFFGIFTKKNHTHIGNYGIPVFNENNYGYAGYGLMIGDKKAQIAGLGGEVTVYMLDYLFSCPEIRRLRQSVIGSNKNSRDVLESVGFKLEGVLREHIVLSNGEFDNLCIYGQLKREWQENKKKFEILLGFMKISEWKE